MTTHLRIEQVTTGTTVDLCVTRMDDLPKHLPLIPEDIASSRDCLQCLRTLLGLYMKDLRLMGTLLAESAWKRPNEHCIHCNQPGTAEDSHAGGCVVPRAKALISTYHWRATGGP